MTFYRFFLLCLLGTIAAPTSRAAGRESIARYYALKNQAELAIVDSDYRLALTFYQEAFMCKRPNEKDIYNAFIVSCLLKDSLQAKRCFDTLVYLGIPGWSLIDDLRQDRIDTGLMAFVARDEKSIRAAAATAGFKRHAAFMDSLYDADQGIRRLAMNSGDMPLYRDSIRVTDSLSFARMIGYIHQNGFPDIYKTGFHADNYRHISSYSMLYLLLRHTLAIPSSRADKAELMRLLKTAVLNGQYDPADYAFFYDESEGMNKYGTVFNGSLYEGKWHADPIDPKEQETIDLARKAIYLDPLEDYRRKLDFMRRCYYFHFFNVFTLMYNHVSYDPHTVEPK